MKSFNELSIRDKLIRIIVSVTLISVAIGFTVVIIFDIATYRSELIESTSLISRVVGDYIVTDLAFNAKDDADLTLSRLSSIPYVESSAIFDANGTLFAYYVKEGHREPRPVLKMDSSEFSGGSLHLYKSITHRGNFYGTIYLRTSTTPFLLKVVEYLMVMLFITAAIAALTYLVASKLQGKISEPILSLESMALKISESGDYSVRVKSTGSDEIGLLGDAFNEMLGQIQKRQDQLEHMHVYLQNIIDSMPSILIGVDRDGRVTQWNMEAARITGVSRHDAEGRIISDVYPVFESSMAKLRQALNDRIVQKSERMVYKFNDEIRYSDMMVYPLIANGVTGAVIRIDDVTSRVRIEEMMIQTEKMMSVGGIAAGMAHEINNPLGGILMNAHNMVRRVSPDLPKNFEVAQECGVQLEKVHEYLEKRGLLEMIDSIVSLGKRASTIVSNMLSFSRRSEIKHVRVDLGGLMDKSVDLAANDYDLKKKYDFRNIEIVKEYDSEMPLVSCIPTEIEQVMLNLLKNAAQAMIDIDQENDPPKIHLRLMKHEGKARIEVEDNGPGMDELTMKRIFEPFFTTKEVGIGTGLGLSVSYFIITNNHRGSITVQSAPGTGSKFIIELPHEEA